MDLAHFLGYAKAHMDHPVGPPLAELGVSLERRGVVDFLGHPYSKHGWLKIYTLIYRN